MATKRDQGQRLESGVCRAAFWAVWCSCDGFTILECVRSQVAQVVSRRSRLEAQLTIDMAFALQTKPGRLRSVAGVTWT